MLTLPENIQAQVGAARHKVNASANMGYYLVGAIMAGLFIGLADVFMMTGGGPLRVAGSPWASLVEGGVFGIGLILVVFAGGELATSAMMILPIGLKEKGVSTSGAARAFGIMIVGNLLGSILVAALVWGGGIMAREPSPARRWPPSLLPKPTRPPWNSSSVQSCVTSLSAWPFGRSLVHSMRWQR